MAPDLLMAFVSIRLFNIRRAIADSTAVSQTHRDI
jgi:hypothetical protein